MKQTVVIPDHCDFLCQILISVTQDASEPWSRPFTLGTDKAIYIENCTFNVHDGFFTFTVDGHTGAVRSFTIIMLPPILEDTTIQIQ